MKADKPIECVGCSTFDVGSILDNSEREAHIERQYANRQEAEQALAELIQKARNVESEPCQIRSEIKPTEDGCVLEADFTFSCQAEVVIFQLATR